MFDTLHELEKLVFHYIGLAFKFEAVLRKIAALTYAIGFGELIKQAEKEINQTGHAVTTAINAFNTACKEVVNQLVAKFAAEGAKSEYFTPDYFDIHIKVNPADQVAIHPKTMLSIFDEFQYLFLDLFSTHSRIQTTLIDIKEFWVGQSVDKMRQAFESRVVPKFEEELVTLYAIYNRRMKWIKEAIKFEASLGV